MGKISIVPDDYKGGDINPALLKITIDSKLANNKFVKFFFGVRAFSN